jgi:SAM-dependent methyltransferase
MRSIGQLRSVGVGGIVACLLKKLRYRLLARRHGFDAWHAKSPYECRGYKREVVQLAEGLRPQAVVEIGCGLGEILSRVSDCRRFGFDIDARVVPAARELHGAGCRFECAGLADVDKVQRAVGDIGADLLVMVNWPHALPWSELAAQVRRLALAVSLKHLIIDTIAPGTPGYAHHHSAAELRELGPVLKSLSSIDGVRTLHVVALNPR